MRQAFLVRHFFLSATLFYIASKNFQCVTRHFKTIPVVEKEALTFFIYMIKTSKSKLDRERSYPMDTD
jgi:histone deacetylase complex subunit SAP30